MSLDLIVIPPEASDDVEAILDDRSDVPARDPRALAAFASDVRARYDDRGDWPWTAPMVVEPSHVFLSPAHQRWEEVIPALEAIARGHGLVIYDPQAGDFVWQQEARSRVEITDGLDVLVLPRESCEEFGTVYALWRDLDGVVAQAGDVSGVVAQVVARHPEVDAVVADTHAHFTVPEAQFADVRESIAAIARAHGLVAYDPQQPHGAAVL